MSKRPKYFYVVGHLKDFAQSLSRGYFEGLTGVSDTPDILNEFLWLRSTALAMPVEELLEINDSPLVCQIDYDDPEALAADNMRMFGRLFNQDPEGEDNWKSLSRTHSAGLDRFLDNFRRALLLQSVEWGWDEDLARRINMGWAESSEIPGRAFAARNLEQRLRQAGTAADEIGKRMGSKELVIDSSEDLAWTLWTEQFQQTWGGVTSAASVLADINQGDEYSYEDFLEAVRRGLIIGAAYYSNEGEWLIQQPRVNIPEESVLIVLRDSLEQDLDAPWDEAVWPVMKDYQTTWVRDSDLAADYAPRRELAEFLQREGMASEEKYSRKEAVEILGLDDKYDVRWADLPHVESKRDRRRERLSGRMDKARSRRFNPEPSLDSEFWGDQGAGAYIQAEDTGRVLLLLRSSAVNEPHTWGIPGGAIDQDESPAGAVRREIQEELGGPVSSEMYPLPAFSKGSFIYHNHLAMVPEEFEPTLNWESADYGWFEYEDLDHLLLHPGVVWARDNGVLDEVFEDYDGK